jgi:hypothetical protein
VTGQIYQVRYTDRGGGTITARLDGPVTVEAVTPTKEN